MLLALYFTYPKLHINLINFILPRVNFVEMHVMITLYEMGLESISLLLNKLKHSLSDNCLTN